MLEPARQAPCLRASAAGAVARAVVDCMWMSQLVVPHQPLPTHPPIPTPRSRLTGQPAAQVAVAAPDCGISQCRQRGYFRRCRGRRNLSREFTGDRFQPAVCEVHRQRCVGRQRRSRWCWRSIAHFRFDRRTRWKRQHGWTRKRWRLLCVQRYEHNCIHCGIQRERSLWRWRWWRWVLRRASGRARGERR